MSINFGIRFGVLAPKVHEQIEEQKLKYDKEFIEGIERNLDSIHDLSFSDYLNDSTREKIMQKMYKRIVAHVKMKNKLIDKTGGSNEIPKKTT